MPLSPPKDRVCQVPPECANGDIVCHTRAGPGGDSTSMNEAELAKNVELRAKKRVDPTLGAEEYE